ncbi:MAG: hypothetical protein H6807_03810 [Planctomycetes bacterium]|nr:hypothetical protein [Planctomycetota bacterium]
MGGRGFPYCCFITAEGEVVYEARPTTELEFKTGLANAQLLVKLRAKAKEKPDDAALKASITILDALGHGQRQNGPSLEEVDAAAKVEGVDERVLGQYRTWKKNQVVSQAMRKAREDGGVAVYEMWKKGEGPDAGSPVELGFHYYAVLGAVKAGQKADAETILAALEKIIAAADLGDQMGNTLEKLRGEIATLKGE